MMRLILMVFVLSLAAHSNPVLAQERHSRDCITDSGCAKDEYPDCCEKPPCGLFRALQVSRAARQNRLQRRGSAGSDSSASFETLQNEDFEKARQKIAPCPYEPGYRRPPHLQPSVKNNCEVSIWDKDGAQESILQGEAVNEINACTEEIEASYEFAVALQSLCESYKSGRQPSGAERLQAELGALQAQIDWLDQELWQYWNACTIVFSAETAERVTKEGVDALRDAERVKPPVEDELAPLTPQPKKASRGGKKRKGK